ncbi:putative competence-damage inducible protein [Candidatus Moduliflexus flocculans]|uniref:CinA-like protein n=1 Tax=Candidatus Moduliflexus flocculans TaxID=1499966 RepID=A0A0S6VVG8_9BACT|nr:putative competence-damage inducible protein [Candidatus Moduliflexus flocculans]
MPVEIISVGSEFIIQDTRNNSVAVIARQLLDAGIEVDYVSFVSGQENRLEDILRQAIGRSNLIFIVAKVLSGEYDTAKKLLTRVLKKRLILNYKLLDAIKAEYDARGDTMPPTAEKQALVPTEAEMLDNEKGRTPAFLFAHEQNSVILLPGQPDEIAPIIKQRILPRLDPKTFRFGAVNGMILKTCGLPLSSMKELLKSIDREGGQQYINYVEDGEEISIILTVKGEIQTDVESRLRLMNEQIVKKLERYVYGVGAETLEEVVGRLLTDRKATVALAESCTGGLIAHKLTNIAGSSAYMERGVVAYSNDAKMSLLDVSPNIIERHGAVSAETAVAMAEGIRWLSQTTYGVAVTGIAGPGGATPEKPVGLVFIAVASEQRGTQWRKCQFPGDRLEVKTRTAQTALDMLRGELLREK